MSVTMLTAKLLVWDTRVLTRLAMRADMRRRLRVARVFTRSADGPAYLFLPPVLLLGFGRIALPVLGVGILAVLVERALYLLLKPQLRRQRPFRRYGNIMAHVHPPDVFSFPSGHTSAAALVAVLVASLAPEAAPVLSVWVVGVGASRVCLGVHFPSDVLAGALMGGSVGYAALALAGLPLPF